MQWLYQAVTHDIIIINDENNNIDSGGGTVTTRTTINIRSNIKSKWSWWDVDWPCYNGIDGMVGAPALLVASAADTRTALWVDRPPVGEYVGPTIATSVYLPFLVHLIKRQLLAKTAIDWRAE